MPMIARSATAAPSRCHHRNPAPGPWRARCWRKGSRQRNLSPGPRSRPPPRCAAIVPRGGSARSLRDAPSSVEAEPAGPAVAR